MQLLKTNCLFFPGYEWKHFIFRQKNIWNATFFSNPARGSGQKSSCMLITFLRPEMQVSIWKTLDLTVNEYTISDSWSMMKLVEHPITGLFNHCTDQFEVFSRFLVMAEVDFWCIHAWGKQTREMDTTSTKPDRSLMWYQYFGICQLFFNTVLRYWVPPNVPLHLSRLIHWFNNRSMVAHYYAANPWYGCLTVKNKPEVNSLF